MSKISISNYSTGTVYSVLLSESVSTTIADGGETVTLPVTGVHTVVKGDSTADAVTIAAAADWAFADGITYAPSVKNEAVTFYCDENTLTYHKIG